MKLRNFWGLAVHQDGMRYRSYKSSPSAKAELFRIVHLLWNTEIIPPDLVKGLFTMLYKKKNRNSFSNYRAICLLLLSPRAFISSWVAKLGFDVPEARETIFVSWSGQSACYWESQGRQWLHLSTILLLLTLKVKYSSMKHSAMQQCHQNYAV